jgi:tetratricopeptide (TPR) repeat protein
MEDTVFFELERLEVAGEDRLELSGRWFGVRGRRFMRPTLTLVAADGRHRALADLEHKPWAAEDGESWSAAFPWEAARLQVEDLELAVAPDIAVALPAPGGRSGEPERAVARGSARLGRRRGDDGHAALESALAETRRLRSELDRVEAAKVEAVAAAARRDAAVAKLEAVIAERDEARADHQQALRAREQALAERDELARARLGLEGERDEAVEARDKALLARDEALRGRDEAVRARDEARRGRDEALKTRAEPPRPRPAPEPEPLPRIAPIPPHVITPGQRGPQWWPRLIAIMALVVAVIVFLVIIRGG